MVRLVVALVALIALAAPAGAQRAPEPVTIAGGLDFPAGIAFDSGGRMYVTERSGAILVVEGKRVRDEPLAEIQTTTQGEAGLLGIAVSPDERYVYVFATALDGGSNRVLRVSVTGRRPEVVVEGLPADVYHNGGGVAFDRDGMLLVSNGETHEGERAQDPAALGGKVYRFTPDGRVPADNPFGDSPTFALGLRNPFGIAIDPRSGAAFVTENGPESQDEVNRIERGANYGWPLISGPAPTGADVPAKYRDPLTNYPEIIVPTGIAFADPDNAPRNLAGDLFFAAFGEQTIHRIELDRRRQQAVSDEIFFRSKEPVVALAWGPEGLYYSTPTAVKVLRLAEREETRSPRATASPPDQAVPAPREDDDAAAGPTLLTLALGALVLALIVAALYVVNRRRS